MVPDTMTAAVMYAPGDIRVEQAPVAAPGAGEVLLKVAACGVCGSDIPRMLRNGGYVMPIICGHEFSGFVEQLGEGVTGFDVGDLVSVPPLIPCYSCDFCVQGEFGLCENYDYFGSRSNGAYAAVRGVARRQPAQNAAGDRPSGGRHARPGRHRAARAVEDRSAHRASRTGHRRRSDRAVCRAVGEAGRRQPDRHHRSECREVGDGARGRGHRRGADLRRGQGARRARLRHRAGIGRRSGYRRHGGQPRRPAGACRVRRHSARSGDAVQGDLQSVHAAWR